MKENEAGVITKEITFPSADGKHTVHGYFWVPESGDVRAIIQLSHGMCEYVQRYDAWARRFAAAGYVFCGNDHLGHGKTAGGLDGRGFTAKRGGAEFLVRDLHTMTVRACEEYPDLPVVLYGHSMGSFAARKYLTEYGNALSAALISGTGGPGNPTGVAKLLAHAVGAFKGAEYRSPMIRNLAFGAYNKRFEEEHDTFSWLTRDKAEREKYAADPYCNFDFTAAGYDTLFSLLGEVSRRDWAKRVPKKLPIFLFAGDSDPVGSYGKGVRAVYDRLIAAGADAKLKLYSGGRHEMHNEINRDEVFDDLITFLTEVLG